MHARDKAPGQKAHCQAPKLFTWWHAPGGGSALEAVMRVWTERQGELRGHYEINLAATALLQLLALRHPALAAVQAHPPF